MIRRGFLIAGGVLVIAALAIVAWPSAFTEMSAALESTLGGAARGTGPTLPAVIEVRAPSTGDARRSIQPVPVARPQPQPQVAGGVPSAGPTAQPATPSVVTPPVYTYPSPGDDGGGGGGGGGGGNRGPGRSPSPSPSPHS